MSEPEKTPWQTLRASDLIAGLAQLRARLAAERNVELVVTQGQWIVVDDCDEPEEGEPLPDPVEVAVCAVGELALLKRFPLPDCGSEAYLDGDIAEYLEKLGYPRPFLKGMSDGFEGDSDVNDSDSAEARTQYLRGRRVGSTFDRLLTKHRLTYPKTA